MATTGMAMAVIGKARLRVGKAATTRRSGRGRATQAGGGVRRARQLSDTGGFVGPSGRTPGSNHFCSKIRFDHG